MAPSSGLAIFRTRFKVTRNLCQIAIRVTHHEKRIIPRTMAANTPSQLMARLAHVVRPISEAVPV
jgi:hypothetical protein